RAATAYHLPSTRGASPRPTGLPQPLRRLPPGYGTRPSFTETLVAGPSRDIIPAWRRTYHTKQRERRRVFPPRGTPCYLALDGRGRAATQHPLRRPFPYLHSHRREVT